MKSRRWFSIAVGVVLTFCIAGIPAMAEGAAQPDPAESPAGVAFRWLNFIFIFGGLAYLIAKYGGAFFRGNAKIIAASINEATAEKAAADRELNEVNAKISHLDQEIAELRESARQGGIAEAERLRLSGRAEIEKIKQAARSELEASERNAQHQLRQIAASMAVDRAGELIRSRMNDDLRARLLRAFVGNLGRSAN